VSKVFTMRVFFSSVQLGTGAMAPPGALSDTPRSPSVVGPRDDQVYCSPCSAQHRTRSNGQSLGGENEILAAERSWAALVCPRDTPF